jgi:8-oxo-dGDP phosphatase
VRDASCVRSTEPLHDDSVGVNQLSSRCLFEGRVWSVRQEVFEYGEHELAREFVDHTGAVAILVLDDDGCVPIIKQYRHPVRAREWEIPAGLLDVVAEEPLEAAKRELLEEADLVARRWNVLSEFYTSPGGSNEAIRIYLARDVSSARHSYKRQEEEADIELRWVLLDELVDAVLERRVQNPSLVVGALAALASRARGWDTLGSADAAWPRNPKRRGRHDDS